MEITRRKTLLGGLALAGLISVPLTAFADEVVKVGFSGPLSGGAALYGQRVVEGMLFAFGELNDSGFEVGGRKVRFELVALDDQYNPSQAAVNVQRLVQQDKVSAVLVPHSGGIYAVQTRNEQQKVLLLAHSSTPEVVARGNKLTVRTVPEYTTYIPAFVHYGMARWGKKLGVATADHDYAKAWVKAFVPAWEKAGGQVVSQDLMSYNKSADFYSGVSRALAAKPDVLLIGGASEPTGLVIKQARELGFKGGFILIDQAKFDEAAKVTGSLSPMEGSIGVLPVSADSAKDTLAFIQRFEKAHPDMPTSSEITLSYISAYALAQAMKLAGTTTDAAAIRAGFDQAYKDLPEQVNFHHYTGVLPNGASTMVARVSIVENGQVVPMFAEEVLKK